jgi:hypothetical protein
MTVRAKFKCIQVTQTETGIGVKLHAVTDGSKENKEFFKWTPCGVLDMATINDEAAKEFIVGKQYYIDIIAE